MGKLYGIGVGPGDKELVTIKAKRLLNEVDIIYCPEKKEGAGSFAFDIVKDHIENEKVVIKNLIFPMNYNKDALITQWRQNAEIITKDVERGKNVAFITLGDPTVYSTFMYVLHYIDQKKVPVEIVPGITSFCAVASRLNLPLVEWEENLAIVPKRKKGEEAFNKVFDSFDNIIFMKPNNDPEVLINQLKKRGLENNFILITKCGTDEETIVTDINVLADMKIPYLSTMLIKKGGQQWEK